MRLVYATPNESVKAILLALKLTGLTAQKRVEEIPVVTLQIDAQDNIGNIIEIFGELSIIRYILEQSPFTEQTDLNLEEWIIYRLKPILLQSNKANFKTNKELLAAISHLETRLNGDYIGGNHPGVSDILGFAYLFPFIAGNSWTIKSFPALVECYTKLGESYASIQEEVGEKVHILRFKKKTENTDHNAVS